MKLVELTDTIIKELVDDADSVSVKEFPSENDEVNIEVMIPENQMGKVIGRQGKTAKSIRTIVQASSYINGNKKVNINIDSY